MGLSHSRQCGRSGSMMGAGSALTVTDRDACSSSSSYRSHLMQGQDISRQLCNGVLSFPTFNDENTESFNSILHHFRHFLFPRKTRVKLEKKKVSKCLTFFNDFSCRTDSYIQHLTWYDQTWENQGGIFRTVLRSSINNYTIDSHCESSRHHL